MPGFVLAAASSAPVPELADAPTRLLTFEEYTAGADELVPALLTNEGVVSLSAQPLCVLELTHELHFFFEQEFTLGLIQQGLVVLRPRVGLYHTQATSQEPARSDYPFLISTDVTALFEWCQQQQYPERRPLLAELLETVVR